MSPKSNRSGVSYDENDPRGLNLPLQRDNAGGPVVTRARDMDAACEGLLAPGPELEDSEEIAERPRPDYSGWTKADLNEELDRREIEHDPKANNPALIELLEKSDAGDSTPPVGS